MRISRAVDYAVRCVHYMSMRPAGTVCILTDICSEQDVPVSFMAKILQGLSKARIVRSIRGPKGGFTLLKHPRDITIKNVVEAIDGPLNINICLMEQGICKRENICPHQPVWVEVQKEIIRVLENYSFEYFAGKRKKHLEEPAI